MSTIAVPLTNREVEVSALWGRGYSGARVAQILGVSVRTVETHVKNVYGKLGVTSRDEFIDLQAEQHAVSIAGDASSPRGCHSSCSCGWTSPVSIGKGAHASAVAEKWAHLDEVSGVGR